MSLQYQVQTDYQQELFEICQKLHQQYPLDVLHETSITCAKEQHVHNNEHIAMHRKKFSDIKSFKEKNEYYKDTLTIRELGFRTITERLDKFLSNPQVQPYENWATEFTMQSIQRKGFKATVLDELLFGNLVKS